jgi:hypothetical protein
MSEIGVQESAGGAMLEPLADGPLREILSASLDPEGRSVECVTRNVFKRRSDWRGLRLFERLDVRVGGVPFPALLLKYNQPADGQRSDSAPAVEAGAYRHLLDGARIGTPRFFGYHAPADSGPALLLMEFVEGKRLKKFADEQTWVEVASWLAEMHVRFSQPQVLAAFPFLTRHDPAFLWNRAIAASELAARISPRAGTLLERVLLHYDRVVEPLTSDSPTLIHGEFYCTNILVGSNGEGLRICPFDWETAAAGCAFMDLTCLVHQRRRKTVVDGSRVVRAYLEARARAGGSEVSVAESEAQMLRCRIQGLIHDIWIGANRRQLPSVKIEKYAQLAHAQLASLESL